MHIHILQVLGHQELRSIVNFKHALEWARNIQRSRPQVKVGFMGGMSAANPQLYQDKGDFIIRGEPENALLENDIASFSGIVDAGLLADLDRLRVCLPLPDWLLKPPTDVARFCGFTGLAQTIDGYRLNWLWHDPSVWQILGRPTTCLDDGLRQCMIRATFNLAGRKRG